MIVNPGLTRGGGGAGLILSLTPAAWFRYGIGVSVSQWDDQSGNARHLLQATATNQPAVQSDGSLLFDGVDNFMKCDAFTLNQPTTVYYLGKQVTWVNNTSAFDGNTLNTGRLDTRTASPQMGIFAGASVGPISPVVDTYNVITSVFNGASSVLQLNNGTPVTGDTGAGNMGGFTLGAGGDATRDSNIQVKEVILFAAAHDAATRSRVIRYLARVGNLGL
jgi:hypothetical protein